MLSYNEVAQAIEDEGRKIGKLAEECADVAQNAAVSEADYKTEFAKARMRYRDDAAARSVKVTVDQVEDAATLEASLSLRTYLVARESLTAIRAALKASEARLDGLRTLASGYRQAGG